MQHEWMLDVLSDLKNYAKANGLLRLVEQLDDTLIIAAAETAEMSQGLRLNGNEEAGESGTDFEGARSHQTA